MIPTWVRPWMGWVIALAAVLGLLAVQSVRLADERAMVSARDATISKMERDHAQALAAASEDARLKEQGLRNDLDQVQASAQKEKDDAKSREDALLERVRSGDRRLSVAARCPASGAAKAGAGAASAGGGGTELQRAELAPEVGIALIGIARDGDQAIRERNVCIAAYEAVRIRLNREGPPEAER